MTKYELSIAKDYVPDWTIVDAVRELFQNAIDQQNTVEGNDMFFEYDEVFNELKIGNRKSLLEPKSLLLGTSTKRDDANTIGKFGEGYKIATLVITRLGKKIVFYNYGAKEVWRPRFVKSRKYDTDVLTFFVDKKHVWQSVPDNNLTIVVEGVTPDEYEDIKKSNLHLQDEYSYWNTSKGQILRDSEYAGELFVNGLHVTSMPDMAYGYNFKADMIELDRDRKLMREFDVQWLTSQIWTSFEDDDDSWDYDAIDAAGQLIAAGKPDVKYLMSANFPSSKNKFRTVVEHTYEDFIHDNGDNAVPVSNQEEYESVPDTHKPVFVAEEYKKVVTSSRKYSAPTPVVKKSYTLDEDNLSELGRHLYNGLHELIDDNDFTEEDIQNLITEYVESI